MKKICILLLLLPAIGEAQLKSFVTLEAVNFNFKGSNPDLGAGISFGEKGKTLGVGVGAALVNLQQVPALYVPVFVEFVAFQNERIARPYANVRIGYGIMDKRIPTAFGIIKQTGRLYLNPDFGILVPVKKNDFFCTIGFVLSEYTRSATGNSPKIYSNSSGFSIHLGLRF